MARMGVWDPVIRLYKNLFVRADPHGKEEQRYGVVWKHAVCKIFSYDFFKDTVIVGRHQCGAPS